MGLYDISAVVITYNRSAMLRQTLKSLVQQDTRGCFSYEIVVIDDGSTDDTETVVAEVARQARPLPLRYVYQENGGEARARNRGVAEARGTLIAFCDDDQIADTRWLYELYKTAQERRLPCVGGSVALLLPKAGGLRLGPLARQFYGEKHLSPRLSSRAAKNCLGAGNILIHRAVFEQVGGFDPAFRQGVDTEFFWRVEGAGLSLGAAPQALVYHVIPEYRLETDYLRGLCFRMGVAMQQIQKKYQGRVTIGLAMLKMMGIALVVDFPQLLLATLLYDTASALGWRCRLWYKTAFIRAVLSALAPRIFPQRQFFRSLDFAAESSDDVLSRR